MDKNKLFMMLDEFEFQASIGLPLSLEVYRERMNKVLPFLPDDIEDLAFKELSKKD